MGLEWAVLGVLVGTGLVGRGAGQGFQCTYGRYDWNGAVANLTPEYWKQMCPDQHYDFCIHAYSYTWAFTPGRTDPEVTKTLFKGCPPVHNFEECLILNYGLEKTFTYTSPPEKPPLKAVCFSLPAHIRKFYVAVKGVCCKRTECSMPEPSFKQGLKENLEKSQNGAAVMGVGGGVGLLLLLFSSA